MSKVKRTDYTSDLVAPPVTFVHDLRYTCKTVADIQRACNISARTAKRISDMQPVRRYTLNAALQTFYGGSKDSALQLQMKMNMSKSGYGRSFFLRTLKAMVRYVTEFRDVLRIRRPDRRYWIFPPKDTMRRMTDLHIECETVLRQICKECPEYCDAIFSDAPDLREKLSRQPQKSCHADNSRKSSEIATT